MTPPPTAALALLGVWALLLLWATTTTATSGDDRYEIAGSEPPGD